MFETAVRDRRTHVFAVVVAGLVAKLAIARDVAVNGDTGLYLYDALQLLAGRTMFVDFPSRSPLFEHLLALAIWLGDAPLFDARALMVGISVGLGLAIYAFGRELFDHRAGLAAAILFFATPFSLVWGTWVKTEQAATLLVLLGFIAAVHHVDRERVPPLVMAGIGAAFGAAFLVRRTAIVHVGAFALFVLWYRHRQGHTLPSTLTAAAGTVAAALATLAVGYLATAHGDPALAWAIADQHAIALFQSGGQGSLGWIYLGDPTSVFADDRGGIWRVCQKCGVNTAITFGHALMVTLPAALLALVPARAWLRHLDPAVARYAPAVVAVPPVWYLTTTGLHADTLAYAVFALAVVVVWYSAPVSWEDYRQPALVLPAAVFAALAAGYLYRDRILYTTYFQDLFPFLAVLVGAGAVAWLAANRGVAARAALAGLLVVSLFAGGVYADPYTATQDNINDHWFTTDLVESYGDDLDARTAPGDRVFTAQPLYLIHSDALPLADLSRRYYLFRGWPDDPLKDDLGADIAASLRDGSAPYAINDTNMVEITNRSAAIRTALHANYCPVDAGGLYNQTGGQLLAHESTGVCA